LNFGSLGGARLNEILHRRGAGREKKSPAAHGRSVY
jgi:hypothetical protein